MENFVIDLTLIIIGVVSIAASVVILFSSVFVVKQESAYIIERFGKFRKVCYEGLNFKTPFVDQIAHKQSLRIHQQDVVIETKTKDDVFVSIKVSVQFLVGRAEDVIKNAFYKLQNPHEQIKAYVFDVVRAEVPKMTLDVVFENKDALATALKSELGDAMREYGHEIVNTLVTDIDPAAEVKDSMNRINAAERGKAAAAFEGETEKIRIVAKAQAEAESKKLQGEGIANQRTAIAQGIKDSVEMLQGVGVDPQEASALIVVTQHYDTLQAIGEKSKSTLILMPNSPSSGTDLMTQMTAALEAHKASSSNQSTKTE